MATATTTKPETVKVQRDDTAALHHTCTAAAPPCFVSPRAFLLGGVAAHSSSAQRDTSSSLHASARSSAAPSSACSRAQVRPAHRSTSRPAHATLTCSLLPRARSNVQATPSLARASPTRSGSARSGTSLPTWTRFRPFLSHLGASIHLGAFPFHFFPSAVPFPVPFPASLSSVHARRANLRYSWVGVRH